MGAKIFNLGGPDKDTSMFQRVVQERSEPVEVFAALKNACLKKAKTESGELSAVELAWLRGVVEEGESALAAIRSLIETGDTNRRRAEGLKIRNKRRRRMFDAGETK